MNEAEIRALVRAEVTAQLGEARATKQPAALRPLDRDPAVFNTFVAQMTETLADRRIEAHGLLRRGGFVATPGLFVPADATRIAARLQIGELDAHLPVAAWAPLLASAEAARQLEAARLFRVRSESTARAQADADAEARRAARRDAANQGNLP